MNNIRSLIFLFTFLFLSIFVPDSVAQSLYQPYSYHFYQKLNPVVYSAETRLHTTVKPFIIDSVSRPLYDSLMNVGVRDRRSWLGRKLFNEHLIEVEKEDFTFYGDFLPDFQIGRSFQEGRSPWVNTRGFQFGGTIGDKFSFYTSGYENQALFPDYIRDYIQEYQIIPGQFGSQYDHRTGDKQDWAYVSAILSYTPVKYLNVTLAYDKHFIGDGYRSMLLSDFSSNYPALKLTGTLGNVQYTSMWAYMLDPFASRDVNYLESINNRQNTGDLGKWGAFQYLDWNVNNRLSLGFFQSILWAPRNAAGNRGFDPSYAIPLIFTRPIESANSNSPDKVHVGLTGKYKVLDNVTTYGQFLLGELYVRELFRGNGYINNKNSAQLGIRGFNTFGVKSLNFLFEYNMARPYTYQHFTPITSYTNYNQPLAHPYGANFRELVGLVNYSIGRFDLSLQGLFSRKGFDPSPLKNYGGDLFKTYENYVRDYGNFIGQGVTTDLHYYDFRAAYLLNPKYNLRFEVGSIIRQQTNIAGTHTTNFLTFGLRSSFRNIYSDF